VRRTGVVHVNRDYVRHGTIDVGQLSKIVDVTDDVSKRKVATLDEIPQALAIMEQSTMPDLSPRHVASGDMDEWMEIYAAINGKPDRYSIYNLAGIKPEQIAMFEDAGISTIDKIPDAADLTERQARQVAVTKSGQRILKRDKIRCFLDQLRYPLYFLDYETFSSVMPPFEGLRPYQQVPFQYSLHIITEPGALSVHREYLHTDRSNPVLSLVSNLRKDIGDEGSIVVWYAPFEKGRNRELADMLPEHASFFGSLNDRIVDLIIPFQSGWFVDKDFLGSASIKKVLPVLAPELAYDGLAISNGEAAQTAWMDLFMRGATLPARETVLDNLRLYCMLDTLAMVRIYEELQAI
jgi:hypothetical protein